MPADSRTCVGTLVVLLLTLVGRAWGQGAEPTLLKRITPFLPPASITRGFTYIDVSDRSEYIYTFTVGAVQSRAILIQKEKPRLFLLFPAIDEQQARTLPHPVHNGYFVVLAEEGARMRKVFDSFDAFGERLLDHTHIGFSDLDGDGVKAMTIATQFTAASGELSSSLFVFTWDKTDRQFHKVAREQQAGEWAHELRVTPTTPGGRPDIWVERPAASDGRKFYWWLYAWDRGSLRRLGYGGPVLGKGWLAEIGPSYSSRIITARWLPMDTPDGLFMDKSEVTFWRWGGSEMEPGERYFTFRDPYELTRDVPRTVDIPDSLWPYYFSPRLIDHLPRRQSVFGQETYALFPVRGRKRTALNFRIGGQAYTALAYIVWEVKSVGDADPDVAQALRLLPYPHLGVDELTERGAQIQVTPRVQIKVMVPTGDDYRDVWTSPLFPEHQVFDGFEVSGETLLVRMTVHGQLRKSPLPFR